MNATRLRARFKALQTRAQETSEALRAFNICLAVKYGEQAHWASRGEQTKRDKLYARAHKAESTLINFVCSISPRDWTQGVPCHWIVSLLTFDDAVTWGELSTVPPPSFGYNEVDARRFAAAVRD